MLSWATSAFRDAFFFAMFWHFRRNVFMEVIIRRSFLLVKFVCDVRVRRTFFSLSLDEVSEISVSSNCGVWDGGWSVGGSETALSGDGPSLSGELCWTGAEGISRLFFFRLCTFS